MADEPEAQPNGVSETNDTSESNNIKSVNDTMVEATGPVESPPFSWL
jgi:hypothetical protein